VLWFGLVEDSSSEITRKVKVELNCLERSADVPCPHHSAINK